MATVHRYVDPDASGSGTGVDWTNAYTSLNAWESAEQTDLVTDGDIHIVHCRASSGTDDTTAVTVDGWTTGASNYLTIQVDSADRHSGEWDGTKYLLDGGDAHALTIDEKYVRVLGLQVTVSYVAQAGIRGIRTLSVWGGTDGTDIRIGYCIVDLDDGDSGYGSGIHLRYNGAAATNNLYAYN